jgi:thiosulfate/3-mercaptopyruvate sulfurtransferase
MIVTSLTTAHALESVTPLSVISSRDLNNQLSDYVVLDARPRRIWVEGHIPRSLSLSWEDYTEIDSKSIPYRMFPPKRMAQRLGALGIDETTPVAVYGDADSSWGGEGWVCWLLAYLGHKAPIVVLTGGIKAWKAEKNPVIQGDSMPGIPPRTYQAEPQAQLDILTAELAKDLDRIQIVDTRSLLERIRGSIPNSVHINWTKFYTGDHHVPLSPDELEALLKDNGIRPDKPVVYYCTGGIRSGYAWMVHQLAGLRSARNYEGGIEAWNTLK